MHPGAEGDMESKQAMFKAFIAKVTASSCGQKVTDACHGIKQRSQWCKPLRGEAVKLMKDSLKASVPPGTPTTQRGDRYKDSSYSLSFSSRCPEPGYHYC